MRYVVSCQRCKFWADATDIRGLGLQVNAHALTCNLDPLLVLTREFNSEDFEGQAAAITEMLAAPRQLA